MDLLLESPRLLFCEYCGRLMYNGCVDTHFESLLHFAEEVDVKEELLKNGEHLPGYF